jgi:putative restriction endonuclease
MANAIFTTQAIPTYDDLPEIRYHFPATYLRTAEQAVGDWIIYYEPRREKSSATSARGRQSYFATARVDRIERDRKKADHFYAFVSGYLEFTNAVPFREGDVFYETLLRKEDGSTNKGRFGRSVRIITRSEYDLICQLGFADSAEISPSTAAFLAAEEAVEYHASRGTIITERPFRDAAFTKVVREAYESTCAMTGLRLVNGGGRCEIEAAHIKPVEDEGPDSPRNGIALSRTIHWMFDRGWLSISESGGILVAKKLVPDPVRRMLNPDGKIRIPSTVAWTPHPIFLRHHRAKFKGD